MNSAANLRQSSRLTSDRTRIPNLLRKYNALIRNKGELSRRFCVPKVAEILFHATVKWEITL